MRDAGIEAFRSLDIPEPPTLYPITPFTNSPPEHTLLDPMELITNTENYSGFRFRSSQDFTAAYRQKRLSPTDVAHVLLRCLKKADQASPPLRAIIESREIDILAQAKAATERYANQQPLSPLDGVPIAIKDELDLAGYRTRVGTKFMGTTPAEHDATVVSRLRNAGAILFGKANMHEIGLGTTGFNPHHGTPRNPYNPQHFTGGSSSGSGAAVAAGLCPIAIGADGGGSIRIPAALCGAVGLKATQGRISEHGAAPLCWSVAHVGPIAAYTIDIALCYAIIAGPDDNDPWTQLQPPPSLSEMTKADLNGITIGIYRPWFEDAATPLVQKCMEVLRFYEKQGATLKDVEVPDLEAMRVAHVISIASEMATAMKELYRHHQKDFGLDIRVNLALAQTFTAQDYVLAQRVRTRAIHRFQRVFEQVDTIATPTTGCTAPRIPAKAFPDGESDLTTLADIMRFAGPGNLTGMPVISFPVGYDPDGLPIGLQLMSNHWNEQLLMRLAYTAEAHVERTKPMVYFDLLESL
jgi:Asp-tRNA(Asn)/Glu-tRNA(Gln) amidotransferase A subunit family amidase